MTPGVIVNTIREHQNNNKTIKAIFGNQFFSKFSMEELEGLKKGIEKEMGRRSQQVIDEKIQYLKKHGFKVQKA